MTKIAIIENSEGLGHFFTRYLDSADYQIFSVWKTSQLPKERFESYIFTGDLHNISDGLLPIHRKEIDFIKSIQDKKIFGSCFFHQLIGSIYGGRLEKREYRFFGWHKQTITKKSEIVTGLQEPYFLNLNVDELSNKPKSATIIATNPNCIYQILKYDKNIITSQSHPEIWKQDAIGLIQKHRKDLSDRCPNLDQLMKHTIQFADDRLNEIFQSNLTKWLLS